MFSNVYPFRVSFYQWLFIKPFIMSIYPKTPNLNKGKLNKLNNYWVNRICIIFKEKTCLVLLGKMKNSAMGEVKNG
jgi:hypothetical protein